VFGAMLPLLAGVILAAEMVAAPVLAQAPSLSPPAPPAAPPASRGERPAQGQTQSAPQAPLTLDALMERLKSAATPEEAQQHVRQIARRWARSGSDVSDLLMARARQAMGQRQTDMAVELLDRVIALQPEWAEAWHVRGIAFFMLQDDARALADFRETLRREPRHFMALGMTAAALKRQGDDRGALRAFRAVRELNPHFEGVKEAIDRLVLDVDGRDA
jgi:tetratricopeptide (TPR) repeat protein